MSTLIRARRKLLTQGGGYDIDAQAIIDEMTTAPTAPRQDLINNLVLALKTAGVWSKLDLLQVYAAHTAQAASINWMSPAGTKASTVNAPVFSVDTGYQTNGTNNYVDTGYNPATDAVHFAQNDACIGVWSLANAASNSSSLGYYDGSKGITVNPRSATNRVEARMNSSSVGTSTLSVATSIGLTAIDRSSSSQIAFYRDGNVLGGSVSQTSTTIANGSIRLGSVTSSSFRALQAAAGFVGASMTASEQLSLYGALSAYLTSVGAV